MSSLRLRVLTCQTNGTLAPTVAENIGRWRATLEGQTDASKEGKIDVVHFPETAFSRYFFTDQADLQKYGGAEEATKGPVFAFAADTAVRFNAYVIVGYAEQCQDKFYNSLYVVDRSGALALNHRKRDLFQPDYTWSAPSGQQRYSSLRLTNSGGQEFTAGIILCQEIIGPQENDPLQTAVASQFQQEGVSVVFFSCCWPKGGGAHKFPPGWEIQLAPLINGGKPFVFCVSDGVGAEPNCLSSEQWGKFDDIAAMKLLEKRGCSGVKQYAGSGAPSADADDTLLPLDSESCKLYVAEIAL